MHSEENVCHTVLIAPCPHVCFRPSRRCSHAIPYNYRCRYVTRATILENECVSDASPARRHLVAYRGYGVLRPNRTDVQAYTDGKAS